MILIVLTTIFLLVGFLFRDTYKESESQGNCSNRDHFMVSTPGTENPSIFKIYIYSRQRACCLYHIWHSYKYLSSYKHVDKVIDMSVS